MFGKVRRQRFLMTTCLKEDRTDSFDVVEKGAVRVKRTDITGQKPGMGSPSPFHVHAA